jgi:hypothetical protein
VKGGLVLYDELVANSVSELGTVFLYMLADDHRQGCENLV